MGRFITKAEKDERRANVLKFKFQPLGEYIAEQEKDPISKKELDNARGWLSKQIKQGRKQREFWPKWMQKAARFQ